MPDTDKENLEKLLGLLMRPLSKLLIQNDIPIQEAVEMLKRSMVDTALTTPEVTDSHVSLKTGVHRKDVRRLRADKGGDAVKNLPINPVALVLTRWANSEMFQTKDGKSRPLTRATFDDLIRTSKIDLPPATVLSEMFTQELVREDDDGLLHLLTQTYLPKTDAAALAAFEATMSDHLRIAVENTIENDTGTKNFDRVLRYSQLSQASVDQLEKTARADAAAYLEKLNTLAYQLQVEDDGKPPEHRGRFVSGVYIAPVPDPDQEDGDQT